MENKMDQKRSRNKQQIILLMAVSLAITFSGCTAYEKGIRYDRLQHDYDVLQQNSAKSAALKDTLINGLRSELADKDETIALLQQDKQRAIVEVIEQKDAKISALELAQQRLAASLSQELNDYKAKLEMTERGLVLTFLAEIFFDPGKDVLKPASQGTLRKIADVLNNQARASNVAVEGHTDSDPIRHSGWKSNWELSTARALAVVHSFTAEGSVAPERLSAVGYGEYRPVASNDTAAGKKQNRRVEIVILPEKITKIK